MHVAKQRAGEGAGRALAQTALPMKYAPRVKRGCPSSGSAALRSPTRRKESGTPCTNSVVCRGSGCTASDSFTTCARSHC